MPARCVIDSAGAETGQDLRRYADEQFLPGQGGRSAKEKVTAAVDLSIHVMDTAFGVPAADVHVGLQRATVSGWTDIAEGYTGPDGRLTVGHDTTSVSATFRLELDLDRYYAVLGTGSAFPRGIVVFRVSDTDADLHLSLLTSPNLLVIYRDSADQPT